MSDGKEVLPPSPAVLFRKIELQGKGVIMTMDKGGVGKTFIATELAKYLAQKGHDVLLATTDPAAHLDFSLGDTIECLTVARINPKEETRKYMETKPGVKGAIGLVHGDMQDFGKNIVHMTLEANGFDVKDLGKSVPAEAFLHAVQEGADFIGISIMTNDGVEEAKKVVQEFKNAGVRKQVRIIVGGAGVNASQAAEIIEADGYAEDAAEVVEFLKIFFRINKQK